MAHCLWKLPLNSSLYWNVNSWIILTFLQRDFCRKDSNTFSSSCILTVILSGTETSAALNQMVLSSWRYHRIVVAVEVNVNINHLRVLGRPRHIIVSDPNHVSFVKLAKSCIKARTNWNFDWCYAVKFIDSKKWAVICIAWTAVVRKLKLIFHTHFLQIQDWADVYLQNWFCCTTFLFYW